MSDQLPFNFSDQNWNTFYNTTVDSILHPSPNSSYHLFNLYVLLISIWSFSRLPLVPRIPRNYLRALSEMCILNLTFVICLPAIIVFNSVISLLRYCIRLYFKHFEPEVSLMNSADAVWSMEWFAESCNFNCLYVLEGDYSLKAIRKKFKLLVENPDYERMRRIVVHRFGWLCWKKLQGFNVNDHVKVLPSYSGQCMTENEVFSAMQSFADEIFPMDKSPWEVVVVPKFAYRDGSSAGKAMYALVFRMHHSIMDGISAGQAIRHHIADAPGALAVDPCEEVRVSWWLKMAAWALLVVAGVRTVMKSMTLMESNCFHTGQRLSGPKRFEWSRKIDLGGLKDLKDATRTSTTAVLLSAIGLALKDLARRRGVPLPGRVYVGPTVAMLPYPNTKPQNRFILAHVPIDVGCKSRGETLTRCYAELQKLSKASEIMMNKGLLWLTGRWPKVVIEVFMSVVHGTVLLSNVPGFKEELRMFGHKLVDAVGWTPLKGTTGIGVCLFSYNGKVRAAIIADQVSISNDAELRSLITSFENQVELLASEAGTKPCIGKFAFRESVRA